MAEENQIQKQPKRELIPVEDYSSLACYLDTSMYDQAYRAAQTLASSQLVPKHYQGKPHDCFVAIQLSRSLGVEPFMLMQNTYVVHGKPGFEAKFVIAMMNSKGPFAGPVQWEFAGQGKTRTCTAFAHLKDGNRRCEATVTWDMVEKEGWNKKEGSKWLTMPELMFQYRSATFLARLYCPEVLFGMQTVEELYDVGERKKVESREIQQGAVALADKLKGQREATQTETDGEIQPATDEGPVIPPADMDEGSTNGIDPSERYYCNECGETFAEPRGAKKDLCPKLHKPIIDRMAKGYEGVP